MSDEAFAPAEMVTVLVARDAAEHAYAESVLREAGVPFVSRNTADQNVAVAGQIGEVNVVAGPPEIQVAPADALRANTLLSEALGDTELEAEPEPEPEKARRALADRYARYSAVWSVFAFWGIGSLLGIYFGIQALRHSRGGALTLTKGLAVFGVGLGLFGLIVTGLSLWQARQIPDSPFVPLP
jgi:Putative prokaryotic signal transducing protein